VFELQEYRTLIQQLEEKRLHLVNAEMLFDLPLTDYSTFIKCRTDMEGLEQIYNLYKQQKVSTAIICVFETHS
jgi:dynein heavy chain